MYSLYELERVYGNLKEGLNKFYNFKGDTLLIVATITVATNHICKAIKNPQEQNNKLKDKDMKKLDKEDK
ncbi:hypothetical protein [Staphylococcus ureilyticus]|uniref:hypothetical protein n=1 Tax=Staphylococcus ureilyticus TaxID=94138 RepID=UPI0021D09A73|nr:hypothetical protein [Staphylococcus ureilyticus]UXS61004.1 hypothetical protein MUA21_05255 [Staphylococcus ureilyticus]